MSADKFWSYQQQSHFNCKWNWCVSKVKNCSLICFILLCLGVLGFLGYAALKLKNRRVGSLLPLLPNIQLKPGILSSFKHKLPRKPINNQHLHSHLKPPYKHQRNSIFVHDNIINEGESEIIAAAPLSYRRRRNPQHPLLVHDYVQDLVNREETEIISTVPILQDTFHPSQVAKRLLIRGTREKL